MVKFIEWLKQWAGFVLVLGLFIFWLYIVNWWTWTDWLTAENNDTLTADKWNSLANKVENWWWTIVEPTDTSDFDNNCIRKAQWKYNPDWTIRNRYIDQIWNKYIYTYRSNSHLWINSTNKWAFLWTSAGPSRTLLKLEKNCN